MDVGELLKGICVKIFQLITSQAYLEESRTAEKYFTRNRKLSFPQLLGIILGNAKYGLQTNLEQFFEKLEMDHMVYSPQAFSKRRQYIKPEAVLTLVRHVAQSFYEDADYETWDEYLLLAVDGTRCNLPCTPETKQVFGAQETAGEPQVQALCSCLYDVLNNIIVDASVNPCTANERHLAAAHLDSIQKIKAPGKGCILIFDRGYPSADLIDELEKRDLKYIMRFSSGFLPPDKYPEPDHIVNHRFAKKKAPTTFRVLHFDVNGTEEHLITNLLDPHITADDFRQLYHLRWEIETAYRTLKSTMEIENFSGILPVAIMQDFYATLFCYNLMSVAEFEMRDDFNALHNKSENRLHYKQNRKRVIDELKPKVVKMLLMPKYLSGLELAAIAVKINRSVSAVRPGRSFQRKKKHITSKFSSPYKRSGA